MDLISSIANLSVALSQQRIGQDVAVAVARKERDLKTSAAASLVQAISPALPDHLGRNLDLRV